MSRSRAQAQALLKWSACALAAVTLSGALAALAGASSLPDGRAYELVSPAQKLGNDVIGDTSRVRAARTEAPGLPMAVTFASLGAFGDAIGTGIATDYLAQRDATPGTSGWSTHAITPPQQPGSFIAAADGLSPLYSGDMADDLTAGVFSAWSALGPEPNIQDVTNLYTRTDLRTPGAGNYQLLTDSVTPQPPLSNPHQASVYAGASSDFRHVVFESRLDLTADATGTNPKVYKADDGITRLLSTGPGCPGGPDPTAPCALAGYGASGDKLTNRVISQDGSRVILSSPVTDEPVPDQADGVAAKLYQLDDRGTTSTTDDALIQINTSEKTSPAPARAAVYQTASTDGSRVFFTSSEQLTNRPGSGLYMWARQPTDETQTIAVDATAGTFTITAHTQPSTGTATLTTGSTSVTGVVGSFSVGQTVTAPGIPAGTTITAITSPTQLTLSAAAASTTTEPINADIQQTTSPIPFDATPTQLQSALENLTIIGAGNATVTGGPGAPGASTPYTITFTGALAGVNIAPLTTDATNLTGAGTTATVTITNPIHNLTLIANASLIGVLGASDDGHRIYFSAPFQLVAGGPGFSEGGIFLWQDADGTPGGTLSYVGAVTLGDSLGINDFNIAWPGFGKGSRVTPDGRHLLFEASDGSGLRPRYQHGTCVQGSIPGDSRCAEVYVYSAETSTPLNPDVVCASCDLSQPGAPYDTLVNVQAGVGGSGTTWHVNTPITDDGQRVFFSTPAPLVPEDVNGKSDAYEYDTSTHQAHLLSTGTDAFDSYFMDATANGNDAFILTRQQLLRWDTDQAYDLYDTRINGGFPEPPPPPHACTNDNCQGQILAPPPTTTIGSTTYQGPGNTTPSARPKAKPKPKRCPKGTTRHHTHGKTRCTKPPHKTKPRAKHATKRGNR